MSDCVIFFCWIDLSLCFCEHSGGISACDSYCNSLHVSSFVVCGSSVKQVSHSWHIVLDTCALYTFLNFIYMFISLLNLYPDSELIIISTVNTNLHTVFRSLEVHDCALTSSPLHTPTRQTMSACVRVCVGSLSSRKPLKSQFCYKKQ